MLYLVITNIATNIALLLLLALLLTKIPFFREILLYDGRGTEETEKGRIWKRQLITGLIFGAFCIISDRIGIQVKGALPNARVIGILSSGFLGGPFAGMMTAVIAAVHRYLIFPERISTTAWVISALLQGVMAAVIGFRFSDRKYYNNWFLSGVTFAAEFLHIILILVLTRPYTEAVSIVMNVIIPMTVMNSIGMVLFFNIFRSIFNEADLKAASMVSLAFRTAERCTPWLEGGLTDETGMQKVIETIQAEYPCLGAAIVRGYDFLGRSFAFREIRLDRDNYPRLLSATKTYKTTRISSVPKPEDAFYPLYAGHTILSAPVILDGGEDEVVALVLLVGKNKYSYQADIEFAAGLAALFATQLKLAEMERQKETLRKAEYRALQAQINPHFLFNALNTISYFCREKPEKARELLIALSAYFRNMLTDIDYMVPLETELEHVRAYVKLEEARFEDRLLVTISAAPEDCVCHVPSLILQPIVENAIRHGATKREQGTVVITVRREEKATNIDVRDNGPGMDQKIIDRLYDHSTEPQSDGGHGIGMWNVQQRLRDMFGEEAGLQIVSGATGTIVRMVIPNESREPDSSRDEKGVKSG